MSGKEEFESNMDPASKPTPDALATSLSNQSQVDFDIAFFDSILRQAPDYVDVLRNQGELLTRKGHHDRALAIDRRLVSLLPHDGVARYNLACSLALSGERAEAIATLRQAIEQGYDDLDYLAGDHDLDSIRDDPAFIALVKEFGGGGKKRSRRKK